MKFSKFLVVLSFLFPIAAFAQTNPNPNANVATNNGQFTLSAKVTPLFSNAGAIPATDVGGTFAVTTTLSLRSDNIIAADQQGYFGGFQYFLSSSKLLAKTNFDPSTFQFYLGASGGLVNNSATRRPGFIARGGVNYDPTHKGKFTINLIEAGVISGGIVNEPGVKPMISGGVSLGF
jgi:hypothetical protein